MVIETITTPALTGEYQTIPNVNIPFQQPFQQPVYPSPCPCCGRCPVCGRGGYEPYKITYTCQSNQNTQRA